VGGGLAGALRYALLLTDHDLARPVTIRGEAQSALAAILRQVSHYGGHAPDRAARQAPHGAGWTVLSIPRGQSAAYTAATKAASGA
jgi:hypothetical protein